MSGTRSARGSVGQSVGRPPAHVERLRAHAVPGAGRGDRHEAHVEVLTAATERRGEGVPAEVHDVGQDRERVDARLLHRLAGGAVPHRGVALPRSAHRTAATAAPWGGASGARARRSRRARWRCRSGAPAAPTAPSRRRAPRGARGSRAAAAPGPRDGRSPRRQPRDRVLAEREVCRRGHSRSPVDGPSGSGVSPSASARAAGRPSGCHRRRRARGRPPRGCCGARRRGRHRGCRRRLAAVPPAAARPVGRTCARADGLRAGDPAEPPVARST